MRIRTYAKPVLSDAKIYSIIKIIRRVYFFFIIWGSLYFISFVVSLIKNETIDEARHVNGLQALINFVAYIAIYVGLKNRKKWVVSLILIGSSFSLIWAIINLLTPSQDIAMIAGKLFDVVLLLFFTYQLGFFSRQEVKNLFNEQGTVFFQ